MESLKSFLEKYKRSKFNGDYLYISPDDWAFIKDNYPRDEVQNELADIVMEYPMPLADITKEDAIKEYSKLKRMDFNDYFTNIPWFYRAHESSNYHNLYKDDSLLIKRTNIGNSASNYFHQKNRWGTSHITQPGPVTVWSSKKSVSSMLGGLYTLKMTEVSKKTLRLVLGLRKYIAAQFKPSVAKFIYDFFKSETVLDFSMGWGDRLAGFYASNYGKKYIGLDPKLDNHPLYQRQAEFYKQQNGYFDSVREHEFHTSPAEDFDFTGYHNEVDLIFTSPPYFNIEKYSMDDTQSWVRYKDIDSWNTEFLHKVLKNSYPTLKQGGKFAINIADVYSYSKGKSTYKGIINPMSEVLEGLGMRYVGCIGMELARRPNSAGAGMAREKDRNWADTSINNLEVAKTHKFGEPIWIWEK